MTLIERIQQLREATAGSTTSVGSQPLAEEIYALLREKLLAPLAARIDGRAQPRLDAEDALHEAFLRAMADLKSFRGTSEVAFLSWVYRIARNLIADHAKRNSAQAVRFAQDSRDETPRISRIESPPNRRESLNEKRDWIEAVLAKLDPADASLIRARQLEDRSYEELGAASGRSPEAAKQAFWRAWQRFLVLARNDASPENPA